MPRPLSCVVCGVATLLGAQTPAAPAAGPAVKWRGGLWASGAASDRRTPDGSLFLNPVAAGEGRLALDGLQLGADIALPEGWSLKFTLLAGRTAQVLNDTDLEAGAIAYPEAMLIWTGEKDVLRFGRMYTAMGMEVLDQTAGITATRGLLFTWAIPFNQVGLAWRHSLSPEWSTDVWLYNGEDRVKDNNRGKTAGVGLNYNHGGASDKFVTLMAYAGAEQDGSGMGATPTAGAEGRKRTRVCATFGWAWGGTTLLGEIETAQETFLVAGVDEKAKWSGAGLILKHQLNDRWALFLRGESMKDDMGVRFGLGSDLKAASFSVGCERRWGSTFTRFELRRDRVNKDQSDQDLKTFKDATSASWSLGTTF